MLIKTLLAGQSRSGIKCGSDQLSYNSHAWRCKDNKDKIKHCRETNKDEINARQREYWQKNKVELNAKANIKYNCGWVENTYTIQRQDTNEHQNIKHLQPKFK